MAYSDTSQHHDYISTGSSQPSSSSENCSYQFESAPPPSLAPLLALIGRLTILGFALAWVATLVQAAQ